MKTFDKVTYQAARAAWDEGDFGPEWREVRRISWERGFPYPPNGTPFDDRDEDEPSQRVIVYRALDYRPAGTIAIVRDSRSWHQVVERIISEEHRLSNEASYRDELAQEERTSRADHRESVTTIANVLRRIADSAGIE